MVIKIRLVTFIKLLSEIWIFAIVFFKKSLNSPSIELFFGGK